MGGAGINVLGRAALGGLRFGGRQLRRGVTLASAPALLPVGQATAAFAGSELGLITGGVVGLAKNIQKSLSSMLKEMKKRNEKEEKIAREVKVERNKETSQRLEDIREGKEGDEDPDSGKGTITSRLGKVLKKINAKTRSAAKGLLSKIPGVGFLSTVASKFTSGFVGMAATWVAGWTAAIAVGALILKFIIDNISDWIEAGIDFLIKGIAKHIIGGEIFRNFVLKQQVRDEYQKRVFDEVKKLEIDKKSGKPSVEEVERIKQREASKIEKDLISRGYSKKVAKQIAKETAVEFDKSNREILKRKERTKERETKTAAGIARQQKYVAALKKVAELEAKKKPLSEQDIMRLMRVRQVVQDLSKGLMRHIRDPKLRTELEKELKLRRWLSSDQFSKFNPKAGGGGVAADRPYFVGEYGPELFIPKVSGFIDNLSSTSSYGMPTSTLSKAATRIQQTGLRTTTASVSATPRIPSTSVGGGANIVTGPSVNQSNESTNFGATMTLGVGNVFDTSVNYA